MRRSLWVILSLVAATLILLACGGPQRESGSEKCDASYPSVCIPPLPPDLDCGDIKHRRFEVRQPDPHGFDADKDGIGCERT